VKKSGGASAGAPPVPTLGRCGEVGKRGRRARREGRSRTPKQPLTIAIVTHPSSRPDSAVSIHDDVDLVRASVLYADHVELVSLSAWMLASQAQMAYGDGTELLEMIGGLDEQTLVYLGADWSDDEQELVRQLPVLLNSPALDRLGFGGQRRALKAEMEKAQSGLQGTIEKLLEKSGAGELVAGLEAGVVSLSSAGMGDGEDFDAVMEQWLDHLRRLLQDPSKRLLFDDGIAKLVAAMVREKKVDLPALTRRHAGEALVGSGLISRLPAFPQAPLDELLDLRGDLAAPLVRYRAAVMEMGDALRSEVFDTDAPAEIDDLWRSRVEPAVLEIEETLAQHGLVREVARQAAQDVKWLLLEGPAFYLGLEHISSLEGWVSALGAAAAPTAHAGVKGAQAAVSGRREAKAHDLFFLYQAQRLMS
jgi:hypothetical protein